MSTSTPPPSPMVNNSPTTTWPHVAIASSFILINCLISVIFHLKLSVSLLIAYLRMVLQLTAMGYVLRYVLDTEHAGITMGIMAILAVLAAVEVVANRQKYRHKGMFVSVLVSLLMSTIVVTVLGTRFAMSSSPFYGARTFVPTVGMVLGNSIGGLSLGLRSCLTAIVENKDQIEVALCYGATKWEATKPVVVESIKTAMIPTLNAMSVMGIITIPGMMTGQILAGMAPVESTRFQIIVMAMITASSAIAIVISVAACIHATFDDFHRLAPSRVTQSKPLRGVNTAIMDTVASLRRRKLWCSSK